MKFVLADFTKLCQDRAIDLGYTKVYRFTKADLVPVRIFLVNLNNDPEQEEFFLDLLRSKEDPVEVSAQVVEHLNEYLTGAQ